jgi:hypothetical protein
MAAGEGFKEWQTGDVLTANDVNGYLNQGIWVFDDAADRTAQVTSPQEGNFAYLRDDNKLYYYTGSAWAEADTSGIQPSEFAAKGDLLAGTGASTFDNLSVGTNGHVLTADSSETTGLKWAAPAAGSGFVGCLATRASNQTISNATFVAIAFTSEDFDTDGFHDNSTNNTRLTIPAGKGGYYWVYGSFMYAPNATGRRDIYIFKNTTLSKFHVFPATSSTIANSVSIGAVINLAAGDYVTLQAYQESGGNLDILDGVARLYFGLNYLGA